MASGFFSRFWSALANRTGTQQAVPSAPLVEGSALLGPDAALQIGAVWSCVDRRATALASLPLFVYRQGLNGHKDLARDERIYAVLHDSPNVRMTPFDFWRAMMLNLDLRGNAYARIERDARGDCVALWPMPSDQVEFQVLDDGTEIYLYAIGNDLAVLAAGNVLHLRGLGNGTVGLAKLEFMRGTLDEAAKASSQASRLFGNGGKPTGVLMVDHVLDKPKRQALQDRFAEMAIGSTARLYVLEADMKYQQLSISPEDQQLLETRRFAVEEICRWFDVPPVLVHHSNVTTWGSGIEQIIAGFHKFTLGPLVVAIQQAITKRVLSPRQRSSMTVEFSMDGLLRASVQERQAFYAAMLQNGALTRNEVRQLENWPRVNAPQADALTVQTNLVPIDKLGVGLAASPVPAQP